MSQTVVVPSQTNQALARLSALQSRALGTLEDIIENEDNEAPVRLRASTAILDYILKLSKLERDSKGEPLVIPQMVIGVFEDD